MGLGHQYDVATLVYSHTVADRSYPVGNVSDTSEVPDLSSLSLLLLLKLARNDKAVCHLGYLHLLPSLVGNVPSCELFYLKGTVRVVLPPSRCLGGGSP